MRFGSPAILFLLLVAVLLPLASPLAPASRAFSDGEAANLVEGQPDFTHSGCNSTSETLRSLCSASDLAFDSSGDLWVVDNGNSRILEYQPPFSEDMAASLVIGNSCRGGQSSLCFPNGFVFDQNGDLWVADYGNSRALEYAPPFSDGMNASLVIGQPDYASGAFVSCNPTQKLLCGPSDVAFDPHGNLWVADLGGSRILGFAPPFSDGMVATFVIGQDSFANDSCASSQTGLCNPEGIGFDPSGDLWVADNGNNRVLEYAPPFSDGMGAHLVVGQPNFTSDKCASNPASQNGLCGATGIAFDSSGNLWVADYGNSRVLRYARPFLEGMKASLVIGQQGYTTDACHAAQLGLCGPHSLVFDSYGNLWVADEGNSRILRFALTQSPGTGTVILVGANPHEMAYDYKKGEIFVTNTGDGTISVISDRTNKVVATIAVGGEPVSAAYDPSNNEIYVANWDATYISVISDTSNRVVKNVILPNQIFVTDGIAYDSNTSQVFVVDDNGGFHVLSGQNVMVTSHSLEGDTPLPDVVYDSNRGELFMASSGGSIFVVSDLNYTVLATIRTGIVPYDLTFDSGKGEVFVADSDSSKVLVIADSNNTIVARPDVGSMPIDLAYDAQNGEVYVATSGPSVSVISDTTNEVIKSIPLQCNQQGVVRDDRMAETFVACDNGVVYLIPGLSNATTTTSVLSSPTPTSTSTTNSTTSPLTLSSTTSSRGGSGIPEFPVQFGLTLLATAVIVASYVLARRGVRIGEQPPV